MDVDQGDASVTERLTAYVQGTAAEAPAAEADSEQPAAAQPVEEVEVELDAEEGAEPQQQEPDTFEFVDDDGEVLKVPAKLKERVHSWGEFVKTKHEVTSLRQQAEDRMQYAAAREQLSAAVVEDVVSMRALQSELQQINGVNWGSLEISQAMQLQQRALALKDEIAAKSQTIQQKAAHLQNTQAQHNAKQWELAEQAAAQRLGKLTAEENRALAQQVQALGFDIGEFKTRYADPRIIHAIHKAAKYDALQASKPAAAKAIQKAPPVVKPGASQGQSALGQQKYKAARDELRKTGSEDLAAKLLARFK